MEHVVIFPLLSHCSLGSVVVLNKSMDTPSTCKYCTLRNYRRDTNVPNSTKSKSPTINNTLVTDIFSLDLKILCWSALPSFKHTL